MLLKISNCGSLDDFLNILMIILWNKDKKKNHIN